MSITITLDKPFMNSTTWELDGYLTNLRGQDLKDAATELGISFKSKTPVGEIREAIRNHYVAVSTDYTTNPEPEELPVVEVQVEEAPNPTGRPAQSDRAATLAWIEEEVAAGRMPFPYGLRGRGIGAKTYLLVSDRTLNRQIRHHQRKSVAELGSPKLPNSERVQNYARANGTKVLTPKQWKRVLSKTNGEDDITVTTLPQDKRFFSHIGTTPGGCFINFQFAR